MLTTLRSSPLALGILLAGACGDGWAQDGAMASVIINGGRPSSLPVQIPTTIETVRGGELEQRVNATDAEDALKYLPSLNVRKRFIGDYDHAVLSSRASGSGNSARSLVYADGILLSNLLGNGAAFAPRWGMVSPEEIDRVDVLYGPFSAAYPGNAAGAVVDFQTRMPRTLEAHLKLSGFTQHYAQYASAGQAGGGQGSASIGQRRGAWSWWADVARLDSHGQPLAFATRLLSATSNGAAGVPVTGALADTNPAGKPWLILGATSRTHTVQDHAKLKLAYDVTPVLRASYTLGWWDNQAARAADSYLRDAAGVPVYGGAVDIGGLRYELKPSDFAPTLSTLTHVMQGLSLKRHAKDVWDWEIAATGYRYARDLVRTPSVVVPDLSTGGAGRVTDMGGSGWHTLALKGIWGPDSAHVVELGYQDEAAHLRTAIRANADWIHADGGAMMSRFDGNTRLQSLYLQDGWRVAPDVKATLGARAERWRAYGGAIANAALALPFGARVETSWSPKAALALALAEAFSLKASLGRAVRNPTAAELFQGAIVDQAIVNSDPNLRAEKSWTGELTAERSTPDSVLRATGFYERTRDALYTQPLTALVNTVQNVGRIRTAGMELAWQGDHVLAQALSVEASATYAHSIIVDNPAFPASVGKRQPRVPAWRASVLASYAAGARWSASLGLRYNGTQYGTLDNSDPHGATYTGMSPYLVADARLRYRLDRRWSAALGVDNLGNAHYWAYHPYPQRGAVAELRFDL